MPTSFGSRFAAQRAELLKRVSGIGFFRKLTNEERQQLLAHGVMRSLSDGEVIFEEGDRDEQEVCFVVSGNVNIQLEGFNGKGGDNTVATLDPGQVFGEMAIFDKQPRSATATAKGLTTILEIDLKDMMENRLDPPSSDLMVKIITHVTEELCRKLRNVNKVLLHSV
ncbi:MAG: cyclic nucleotide-binding domain-containing protein [bacterium]